MRIRKHLCILMILAFCLAASSVAFAQQFSESTVRYILADITKGGPISYYVDHSYDPNALEALQRWQSGVRVLNGGNFERRYIGDSPWIVYSGTTKIVDGMDVKLTTDARYNDTRVRYILADMATGGPLSYYMDHLDDPHAAEAVRRWRSGVRVVNAGSFRRIQLNGTWEIVYVGTTRTIDGSDVRLTSD